MISLIFSAFDTIKILCFLPREVHCRVFLISGPFIHALHASSSENNAISDLPLPTHEEKLPVEIREEDFVLEIKTNSYRRAHGRTVKQDTAVFTTR